MAHKPVILLLFDKRFANQIFCTKFLIELISNEIVLKNLFFNSKLYWQTDEWATQLLPMIMIFHTIISPLLLSFTFNSIAMWTITQTTNNYDRKWFFLPSKSAESISILSNIVFFFILSNVSSIIVYRLSHSNVIYTTSNTGNSWLRTFMNCMNGKWLKNRM